MLLTTADPNEQLDPAGALVRELGAQLREVRLERGEELEQVAGYLRIKQAYLHAIEEGDLAALPGRPYALGFLRTYADHLGFDGNELIMRIRNVVGDLTNRSRLHIRTPLPENQLPRTPLVVLSLVLAAGVYAGWSYLHGRDAAEVEAVSEVPDDLRQMKLEAAPASMIADVDEAGPPATLPEEVGVEATQVGSPEPRATPEAGTGLLATVAGPEIEDGARAEVQLVGTASNGAGERASGPAPNAGPDEEALPRAADEPAVAPDAQDVPASVEGDLRDGAVGAPAVHGATNTEARVILRARSTSWIRISGPDGDYEETTTLLPGETFLVPNRDDLTLWTGNAGGLEVIVDGERMPPLGGEGAVLRRVPLDPQALLARAN